VRLYGRRCGKGTVVPRQRRSRCQRPCRRDATERFESDSSGFVREFAGTTQADDSRANGLLPHHGISLLVTLRTGASIAGVSEARSTPPVTLTRSSETRG